VSKPQSSCLELSAPRKSENWQPVCLRAGVSSQIKTDKLSDVSEIRLGGGVNVGVSFTDATHSHEVLNSLALSEEFVGGGLDTGLGDLVVKVEASHGGVLSGGGGHGEGEHNALGDVVEFAVSLEGNGLPLVGSLNPVAHVVDSGVSGGSGGGELSELNDLGTSLLDTGGELISDPAGVNEAGGGLAGNGGVSDVGVHGGRVVSPDGHLLDVGDSRAGLEGKLSEGSAVVETGHGGEVGSGDIGGVVLADEGVGVCGVSDDDTLDVTVGVVVDGLADVDENLAVVLEEVSTLHSGATGLGTDEEVVVNILEGGGQVAGDDDVLEERESAVMEFSLDTLEDLLLEREVEEVKDDLLVLAEEFSTVKESKS